MTVLGGMALAVWLVGCDHGGSAAAGGFEGRYVQVDNTNILLILENGKYRQGTADIHAEGNYHAHAAGDGYEIHIELTGDLAGNETSLIVKKQGEDLQVKDGDSGEITQFRRVPSAPAQ